MDEKAKGFLALIEKACAAFEKNAGTSTGHIHFSYKGKSDRIVLICHKGLIKQTVAKDERCKKGQCISWSASEFSNYSPEEAFFNHFYQIEKIEVSHPKVQKSWNSLAEFEEWLNSICE